MNLFKKTTKWSIGALTAFCLLTTACSGNKSENSESSKPTEQQVQTKASDNFLGTYEVTDKAGKTFKITLNSDKTATVTAVGKKETVYYCSWSDFRVINEGIKISYSDGEPKITYPGGVDDHSYLGFNILDGWLYPSDKVSSKNPKWRLEAKKVQ